MSTADLAVIAVTVLGLANVAKDYMVQMKAVDRLRLVSPVKQPEAPKQEKAAEPAKTGPVPLEKVS